MSPSSSCAPEHVVELVEEIVRSGLILADLISGLLESMPPDAYPGEDPARVLFEMVAGSAHPAAAAVGIDSVIEATALIGAVLDRTLEDLRTVAGTLPPA